MQTAAATSEPGFAPPIVHPLVGSHATRTSPTSVQVANSQSIVIEASSDLEIHPIPTLDGLGLMATAIVLVAAAFWIWRRQQ